MSTPKPSTMLLFYLQNLITMRKPQRFWGQCLSATILLLLWSGITLGDTQQCEEVWIESRVDFSWVNRSSQIKLNVVNEGNHKISRVRMIFTESENVYEKDLRYRGLAPRESTDVFIDVLPEDLKPKLWATLYGLHKTTECKSVITLSTGQTFQGSVKRLGEYKVGGLSIHHFEQTSEGVTAQYLELVGKIGPDSTFYMESLLKKYQGKISAVLLNSSGGVIKDGVSLAAAINKYGTKARVPSGADCASSCAVAFLGANKRYMHDGSTLSFHSPYYSVGDGYRCTEVQELKTLFVKQLGASSGSFAYKRMMDFCGPSKAWRLNKDAADLIGMNTK